MEDSFYGTSNAQALRTNAATNSDLVQSSIATIVPPLSKRLAFFDSGMGGLSVLHYARKILPHEDFIFFADEDNVPYGTKTPEEVLACVDAAFKFLIGHGVGAIVVACNTATSVAVKIMREKYSLPIIGMEPALKVALDLFPARKVLVTATAITITGEKIRQLIERLNAKDLVELKALPRLVEFAERQEFNSSAVEEYLRGELANYDWEKFSSLVLGCTHFNYFKDTLRKILPPHVRILDGNAGTVNELIRRTNLKTSGQAEKLAKLKALPRLFEFTERQEFDSAAHLRGGLASYDLEKFSSPHVKILDGNAGTVNELIKQTNLNASKGRGTIEFFYSGRRVTDAAELSRLEKFLRRLDDMEAIK